MGKSARASAIKKNNSALKKRVFGPVEMARSERLSAKLLELASQPKPTREEMEVEGAASQSNENKDKDQETSAMDVDGAKKSRSDSEKKSKSGRVQKSRHRRARNEITFAKHPMKSKKKGRKN